MMVHSVFDFNLHILSNMLVFAYVLGMISGVSSIKDETGQDNKIQPKAHYNQKTELNEHARTEEGHTSGNENVDWEKGTR